MNADSSPIDRVREPATDDSLIELMERRKQEGWTLAAVEWQRPGTHRVGTLNSKEVPYGLQVAHDFLHLEENPIEVEAMILVLDSMVGDRSLSETAVALNNRGLRDRQGEPFTQQHVFELMPRIVEAAPDIFGTENWRQLRRARQSRRLQAV